jgi:hypothetical protein
VADVPMSKARSGVRCRDAVDGGRSVRLRVVLDRCGTEVRFGSHRLLTVPHAKCSEFCFGVSDEPDPCDPNTAFFFT